MTLHTFDTEAQHWSEMALDYLRAWLALVDGAEWTLDAFWHWARHEGLPAPPTEQAVFSLARTAVREGLISISYYRHEDEEPVFVGLLP